MNCPICSTWSEVMETRKTADGVTRRRHECANTHRFTTKDNIVVSADKTKPPAGRPINTKQRRDK